MDGPRRVLARSFEIAFWPERPPRRATSAWVKPEAASCAAKWARSVVQSVMSEAYNIPFRIFRSTAILIGEITKENRGT